jgi:CotH protein
MRRTPSLVLAVLLGFLSLLGLVGPAAAAPAAKPAPAPVSSADQPYVNEGLDLRGDIGTAVVRKVTLQHYSSRWTSDQTVSTNPDGTYSLRAKTSAAERQFRVLAAKTATLPEVTSAAVTIKTRTDAVRLVLSRTRALGLATGTAAVVNPGRLWALQVKNSSWTTVGAKAIEGPDGRISASFPLKSGSYRLVGDPVAKDVNGKDLPGATAGATFDSGPKTLGKHVLFVTTDSGGTPKTKGQDYPGTAGLDDDKPLPIETIAVRGNSSATFPKKAYKLKFIDSQVPFGLPKGKTFVLLANYQDHSLVRTAAGMTQAAQLDGLGWTPHRVFTELFLNGKYLGSYELIESVKIQQKSKKNDARVNIDAEKGVIIEINPATHAGTPGLFKGAHGMWYGFKDPDETTKEDDGSLDPEGVTPAKTAAMKTKITNFESALYGKNFADPVSGWRKYLDEDSAVDFYLESEFIKNWDGDFFRSVYFYTGDYSDPAAKLVMGPIWDLDRSAAAKTSGTSSVVSTKDWWLDGSGVGHANQSGDVHKTQWFAQITKDKEFQKALKARWAEKRSTFKAVGDTGVDAAVNELGTQVAANDRATWGAQPSIRYLPRAKTYAGEVTYLKKWYQGRYSWMDSKLG